jgi:YidC/Oxa1 family membrane protein insertase
MQQQQRFIVALVASAAVLILWNVLFPPVKPPQQNANANNQAVAQSSPQPTSQSTASTAPTPAQTGQLPSQSPAPSRGPTPDSVQQRKLRITTPLYEVTFDTRGAVATSWIVNKVKRSDGTWRELNSAGSTKNNPKRLELIMTPPAGIAPEQLFRPFQIVTGTRRPMAFWPAGTSKFPGQAPNQET